MLAIDGDRRGAHAQEVARPLKVPGDEAALSSVRALGALERAGAPIDWARIAARQPQHGTRTDADAPPARKTAASLRERARWRSPWRGRRGSRSRPSVRGSRPWLRRRPRTRRRQVELRPTRLRAAPGEVTLPRRARSGCAPISEPPRGAASRTLRLAGRSFGGRRRLRSRVRPGAASSPRQRRQRTSERRRWRRSPSPDLPVARRRSHRRPVAAPPPVAATPPSRAAASAARPRAYPRQELRRQGARRAGRASFGRRARATRTWRHCCARSTPASTSARERVRDTDLP